MAASPRISVVIPVYNRERYVQTAIDSILAQSCQDFELLIIDDGSTDASAERVMAYKDPRIRLIRQPERQGIPKTRNAAVKQAQGTYLAFLDSDDQALPRRLELQMEFLDRHPRHAAVGAWIAWMDEEGRSLGRTKRKAVTAEEIAARRLFSSGLENSASMARTSILRAYGHRESYSLGSDFDLWARIAADHKLANLPRVLVRRRHHPERTTLGQSKRIKRLRLRIYGDQISGLGIPFSTQDLERHFLLRRMHKEDFKPDRAYVNWAENWLLKLHQANAKKALYPEPAFAEVLGEFWLKVCWHAAAGSGWTSWWRFWRSPLHCSVWPGLRHLCYRATGRLLPRNTRP